MPSRGRSPRTVHDAPVHGYGDNRFGATTSHYSLTGITSGPLVIAVESVAVGTGTPTTTGLLIAGVQTGTTEIIAGVLFGTNGTATGVLGSKISTGTSARRGLPEKP